MVLEAGFIELYGLFILALFASGIPDPHKCVVVLGFDVENFTEKIQGFLVFLFL
jgi:hypothetical protein